MESWSTTTNARPCLVVSKTGKVTIRPVRQPKSDDWEIISGNVMLVRDGKPVPHDSKGATSAHRRGPQRGRDPVDPHGRRWPQSRRGGGHELRRTGGGADPLGCHRALNTDGGGSSVLAVRDPVQNEFKILNEPTDGCERAVANVLGISVDTPAAR